MQEYQVMKKAEERALVIGIQPMFMFIGVILLMFSIVGIFLGTPSLLKFFIFTLFDTIAFIIMKLLSVNKKQKKVYLSKLVPLKLTIKGK